MLGGADPTPGTVDVPVEATRPWPRVLVDRAFGRYLAGNLLTMLGIWIYNIVAVVVAYEATGSALVAGAVTAAQFIPQLLVAPLAGAAADRWNRKVQAAVGQVVSASGSGGLALWAWSGGLDAAPAPSLILASAVVGVGGSISGPAMLALVPAMVRPGEVHTAVTLGMAPLPLGRALGPILGTSIAVSTQPAVAFALTAATNLLFLLLLTGIRPRTAVREDTGDGARPSARGYLRGNPTVVVLLLGVAAVGMGTDPAITLAPAISESLGRGTALAGPIATAFGVGAGLGFALIPVARRLLGIRRYGYTGLLVMAAGMGTAAVATVVVAAMVGFVLAGAGLTLAMTGLSSTLQMSLPEALRGRVMALWSVAFVGTRPLAAMLNGAVADHVSVAAALAGVAVAVAVAGCLGLLRGGGREP